MKTSHVLILLVLGASALGLAGQALAQPLGRKSHTHHQSQRQSSSQREDALLAQLNLSPDQQQQVQALRQKYDAQLAPGKGQAPAREEAKKLRLQREDELARIFTPEQRTKWEELHAQQAGGRAHRAEGRPQGSAAGLNSPKGGGK
ncbi:MAG: hypothetical protein IT369_21455 [Candidatus Latescibacteria bacterium]|nr:hypothetical protein [Candidatus Latescibacterota bacterium]